MSSTILFLDKPRHLRYDIQAIIDLDKLLINGFLSLFLKEADMDTLKLIYWAGLKHEDPIPIGGEGGVGDILFQSMSGGIWTYRLLTRKFYDQLYEDEWLISESKRGNTPIPIREYIKQMEELNYKYLHLSPKDFYSLTPREFNLMITVSQEKTNHDIGLVCATIANCSGAKKSGGGVWTISDFVPVTQKEPKPQTSEEMGAILMNTFGG